MTVPISYSLYSSREFLPTLQTLEMIADLGYTEVEGYDELVTKSPELVNALESCDLRMPSFHANLVDLERNLDQTIAIARKLSSTHVYTTYLLRCDRPKSPDEWRQFAARLSSVAEKLRSRGLNFGWHNHGYEFEPLEDGSLPMDIILAGAPNITWEADLAWIKRAGFDPAQWLQRYSKRISAVHLKDIALDGDCDKEGGWADVGYGSLCWPTLLDAVLRTSARQFVIEHGDPSDHERFAARSIDTVASHFWNVFDSTDVSNDHATQQRSLPLAS